MHWIDYVGVIIYFAILIWIAVRSIRQVKTSDDFAVAGNRIVWPILFATLAASFLGGGASMGRASKAVTEGYAFMFAAGAFPIAVIISGLFVAPKLKQYKNAHTIGDVMEVHYGAAARALTGVISLVFCVGILGAQALAVGTIFNIILGIDTQTGILLGMGVVLLYSTLGGMWAVIQTDVVQFVMLAIFLPLTLIIGVSEVGGPQAMIDALPDAHFTLMGGYSVWAFVSIFVAFLLGETLVPPYAQRALAAPDSRHARIGYTISGVFGFLFYFISTTIGLLAFLLFPDIEADKALPQVISMAMPIGIAGLVLASLLAVVMSTADSYLNSAAVVFVQDLWQRFIQKDINAKGRLWLERVVNLLIGAGAVIFALYATSIVDALLLSYALWAPTVLLPFVFAVVFNIHSPRAATWAMIAGALVTSLWKWGPGDLESVTEVAALMPGVAANLVVFFTTVAMEKKRNESNSSSDSAY